MDTYVFLVEDHAVMRRAIGDLLAAEPGFDLCGTATSAEDALEALAARPCDVLVTDVGLPGMDGVALAARVREAHPELPVVVISARDEPAVAARARAAGARAFLPKLGLASTLPATLRALPPAPE